MLLISIENTIEYKRGLIDTFRKSLDQAKKDYKFMLEEQRELKEALQNEEEASSKEQRQLKEAVMRIEEALRRENTRMAEMSEDYEATKKEKTKVHQEVNAELMKILQEMDSLEQEKQLLEDEHTQTQNILFLNKAIEPLEMAEKEIEQHKKELQSNSDLIKKLTKEAREEHDMLLEDLSMHLFQRAEYITQKEDLIYLHEQLKEYYLPSNTHEINYRERI